MENLFTYGSLMCEDILFAVVGRPLFHTRAISTGYCRLAVKNEQYPVSMPSKGQSGRRLS